MKDINDKEIKIGDWVVPDFNRDVNRHCCKDCIEGKAYETVTPYEELYESPKTTVVFYDEVGDRVAIHGCTVAIVSNP